jgi:hypothetical protein
MPDIRVTINQEQLDDLKTRLTEIKNGVPMALTRAINKTCTSTRTDMVAMARETHNYYAAALRERIIIRRATWSSLSAKVVSSGKPIHLFDMPNTSWGGRTSPGVRANVEKATGVKTLTKAWFGPAKRSGTTQNVGKPIVYQRTSDPGTSRRTQPPSRYPIKALYAPHPEVVYYQDKVWKSIQYLVDFSLEKHLNHEVDAIIKKYAPSDEGLND